VVLSNTGLWCIVNFVWSIPSRFVSVASPTVNKWRHSICFYYTISCSRSTCSIGHLNDSCPVNIFILLLQLVRERLHEPTQGIQRESTSIPPPDPSGTVSRVRSHPHAELFFTHSFDWEVKTASKAFTINPLSPWQPMSESRCTVFSILDTCPPRRVDHTGTLECCKTARHASYC